MLHLVEIRQCQQQQPSLAATASLSGCSNILPATCCQPGVAKRLSNMYKSQVVRAQPKYSQGRPLVSRTAINFYCRRS